MTPGKILCDMNVDQHRPMQNEEIPEQDAIKDPLELNRIYGKRFNAVTEYRTRVWRVLVGDFFQRLIPANATVLDLGAGYGEFINQVSAAHKYAMDLNPELRNRVNPDVEVLLQNCTHPWRLEDNSLDVVFTSNFFEHLPDKGALKRTFAQIHRCLKPGGRLIALGPNIRYLHGAYWDFWDHFLCLTDKGLCEGLENNGFEIVQSLPRFLPYSMTGRAEVPVGFVKLYLKFPPAWRVLGKQFLVVAQPSGK